MSPCKIANFFYSLVPLRPWRDFLIRRHFDKCSRCQAELASPAESRSLFVQEAGVRTSPSMWGEIEGSLADQRDQMEEKAGPFFVGRRWRWAAAAAGIILVLLAGYSIWKTYYPEAVRAASAPLRFELDYVRVGGQPANAFVYQPQGSDIIIVWAGKN
jgi:hypothetical protein